MLLRGNCLDLMREMDDDSVDSIVTDPPYELGFMGKAWDNSGIAYNVDLWRECLRVLKPGGHLLAFGGSRTYHRLACAVEDAGFKIRDQIMWLYGSGFPKSLDVSKALDKSEGAEREVVSEVPAYGIGSTGAAFNGHTEGATAKVTRPASPEAERWDGWGTALKPAHEPIVVARKPLVGTVAANVLTYGTGALNIDGCRVGGEERHNPSCRNRGDTAAPVLTEGRETEGRETEGRETEGRETEGRWPANVIHDGSEEVLAGFPDTKGGSFPTQRGGGVATGFGAGQPTEGGARQMGDEGSAARFFYCAKASKAERNAGLDGLPESNRYKSGGVGGTGGWRDAEKARNAPPVANVHPTVKPLALMRYLVRLVTPPGGVVLDPFLGSGTTAVAAILEGFDWLGCEMTEDYWPIIEARVKWAHEQEIQGTLL